MNTFNTKNTPLTHRAIFGFVGFVLNAKSPTKTQHKKLFTISVMPV